MKGKDKIIFYVVLLVSFIIGSLFFDFSFNSYSDIITFLSIMIGFKITSLSILYNSPLKTILYDRKINKYHTELHRLRDFYKHSIYFDVLSIIVVFFLPNIVYCFSFLHVSFKIGKFSIVSPILWGSLFCFYKICDDLFRIFVFPTNHKN